MRLPCSKGEQHLTSWGRRVDTYIPCIPEPLFSDIHFSGSQQLCFWGAQEELFRSLYQVIWNGASPQIWMTPHRKSVEYICLVKGGTKWAGKSFPHSHLPSHCLHRSAGKRAEGKQLEWCQHLGLLAAFCSRSLGSSVELSAGKTLCCVSQSCWNMMCYVSTFGRALLTLPCSLLRVRQIQSPWPQWVTQAWPGLRSCPLVFSKREKIPPAACNCRDTENRFCFHNWPFDSHDSQTWRDLIRIFCLSGQRPGHLQGSTLSLHRVCWDGEWMCWTRWLSTAASISSQCLVLPTQGRSHTECRCQIW